MAQSLLFVNSKIKLNVISRFGGEGKKVAVPEMALTSRSATGAGASTRNAVESW